MLPDDLDPRKLSTFRVVVESGSITLAAKRLHLSQPALTAQVKQLESAIGKPLLVRRARGVAPTEAGKRLLPFAERMDALLEEALEATHARVATNAPLVLGASTTIASYVVPALLAAYGREYGLHGVRVEVANTSRVLEWVESGTVPLGLVEGPPRAARVRLVRYIDDELLPMVSSDAPRELARIRTLADIVRAPLLFREPGSGTREVVERALLRQAKRRPAPTDLELGSTEAIRHAALLGLGVAFLSRFVAAHDLAAGRLRILPVADLDIRRAFSWAMRGRDLGRGEGRFYELARRIPPKP